jgi:gliding motility-associated-like protein
MKRLIVFLFLLISFPLAASHIVGGEIELLHVTGFTYRINLIYYFDFAHNPNRNIQAEEPSIEVSLFRKSDNVEMQRLTLQWLKKTRVPYTQPSCSNGEIITDKIVYTNTIELPATQFSDPQGYYISWARCCRNYSILNIISQDPQHGGQGAGQTFYLEFPPVTVGGKQFINSSPKNFPALNDYACPTKPYYVDFAGIDDDGDSLVYTLATPLSTVAVTPVPPPTPRPYPDVTWLSGFGLDRVINGVPKVGAYPDLSINNVGFLRVTPRSQGLYVFAVRVEEYRNKIKIGEVRRDFQMLVTDCRLSAAPDIKGKAQGTPAFTAGTINAHFDNTVSNENRYVTVSISDIDATRAADNFQEVLSLKLVALNFKNKDLSSITISPTSGIIHNTETLEAKIFFPACPFFSGGPYEIGVVAYDDACALPLTDTLKVMVDVEQPHNERAKFNPPDEVTATLNEGDQASWQFEAHDAEGEDLQFFALADFSLSKSGMKTDITTNQGGTLKGNLSWDAFCDIYDFTKRTDFMVKLLVDDIDECDANDPDTLTFHLNVVLPPDNKPVIDTDLTADPFEVEIDGIEKRIFDKWTFNVTGKDADNDQVTVRMVGDGYNPGAYGMIFPKATAVGSVSSAFNWDLLCEKFKLDERDSFNIAFLAIDSLGKCRVRQTDSLTVKVKVLKPLNQIPLLGIQDQSTPGVYRDKLEATLAPGQNLDLVLNGLDADKAPADILTLKLTDVGGDDLPLGWTFEDAEGPSVLIAPFKWAPDCSIFKEGDYEMDFYFEFTLADNRCLSGATEVYRLNVKVKDVEGSSFERDPANVFTPNGDGINDFYSMERRDDTGELVSILPPDNCQGVFESVRIYNRWGRTVFTSSDRNFRWSGQNESAGVYFYHVTFSNKEFKGTVSLRD